jgi:hypothetical protein
MAISIYPKAWPCPTLDNYAIRVDMGIIRTRFGSGGYRQRRKYRNMPEAYTWSFVIETKNLYAWQEWVKNNAYKWFQLNIFSGESTRGGTTVKNLATPHIVRFTTDLQIEPFNGDKWVRISVGGELAPRGVYTPPAVQSDEWIVAKTPADPSIDWVVANRPSTVPDDYITAGSPLFPAAFI